MRRSKAEQIARSLQIIDEQAKQLVEVYGWDVTHVKELADDLKSHAEREVESFGDSEDVSGCWKLCSWKSSLKTHLTHNFRDLEDVDSKRAYELRGLSYELSDAFVFIENIEVEKLSFVAEHDSKKGIFGVQTIDEKYIVWDLEDIEKAVKSQGTFEVAKKIYQRFLEKNTEINN